MDNVQKGPPGCANVLADVINRITYKPGWCFTLDHMTRVHEHLAGSEGLTLRIQFAAEDSTTPGRTVGLDHYFVVPPAAYSREAWERWVLECIFQMECHEAMEHFKVDGWAPFFPAHGPQNGMSPYTFERRRPGDGRQGCPPWP